MLTLDNISLVWSFGLGGNSSPCPPARATMAASSTCIFLAVAAALLAVSGGTPHAADRRRLHHRKADAAAPNDGAIGNWQVLDRSAPLHGHKHPPSCILAQFNASIVVPIQHSDGDVKNKTIVVPGKLTSLTFRDLGTTYILLYSAASAHASGGCSDDRQRITLVWNNTRDSGRLVKTGQVTMLFTKNVSMC